jgi:phage terminase Nu1 subunit (DNA packaging protein)
MKGTEKNKITEELPELGEPMGVNKLAKLLGCSAWTVRQKHLRQGLPCFRSGPSGRLTFYRNQVVAWILERQKKHQNGGNIL